MIALDGAVVAVTEGVEVDLKLGYEVTVKVGMEGDAVDLKLGVVGTRLAAFVGRDVGAVETNRYCIIIC